MIKNKGLLIILAIILLLLITVYLYKTKKENMDNKHYRAVILILASNNNTIYKNCRKIWKQYMNVDPTIKVFFVYGKMKSNKPTQECLSKREVKEVSQDPAVVRHLNFGRQVMAIAEERRSFINIFFNPLYKKTEGYKSGSENQTATSRSQYPFPWYRHVLFPHYLCFIFSARWCRGVLYVPVWWEPLQL